MADEDGGPKKDYADLVLDRPRRIRYRWQDVKELARRTGGASLQGILGKLAEADPEMLTTALLLGLRHEDPKLNVEKLDDILDAYFRTDDGRLSEVLNAINEGLQNCGLFRDRSKKGDAATGPR